MIKFSATLLATLIAASVNAATVDLRIMETTDLHSNMTQFIVDSNGLVRKAWQLDEKSSAIVVLDKDGRVKWAKDGALTQQEVQQVIDLLHKLLNK